MVKWKPLRHWIDLFFYHRSRPGAIQFDPFKQFYREKNFFLFVIGRKFTLQSAFSSHNRRQNCWHVHLFNPLFRHCTLWSFFCPPSLSFQPPSPQTMLCGNCCDLELQTSNIEWGSGVFCTVYCAIKRMVFFGALRVLLKDNVATNYVTDCSTWSSAFLNEHKPS